MSEQPKVRPAMDAEEWKRGRHVVGQMEFWESRDGDHIVVAGEHGKAGATTPEERHALAALCLHDQPYGFTREDVELLRGIAGFYRDHNLDGAPMFTSLADRIEALLPPEGESHG